MKRTTLVQTTMSAGQPRTFGNPPDALASEVDKAEEVVGCDQHPLAWPDSAEDRSIRLREVTQIALHAFATDPEYLILFAEAAVRAEQRKDKRERRKDKKLGQAADGSSDPT